MLKELFIKKEKGRETVGGSLKLNFIYLFMDL